MAKNYAKRDFKKRAPTKAKTSLGWLWLVTGILIGGFGFGLIFLKKNVTVIESPQQATLAVAKPVIHKPQPPVQKAATEDKTSYDFYTMLPNSPATSKTDEAAVPVVKPTKPLAEAEQTMLSKTTPAPPLVNNTNSEPSDLAAMQNTQPTIKEKPVKKALDDGTRYSLDAGSFDSYELADAHKAELAMSGFDHVHIESSVTGSNKTHYRVIIGQFKTKNEATTVQNALTSEHFTADLITSP